MIFSRSFSFFQAFSFVKTGLNKNFPFQKFGQIQPKVLKRWEKSFIPLSKSATIPTPQTHSILGHWGRDDENSMAIDASSSREHLCLQQQHHHLRRDPLLLVLA